MVVCASLKLKQMYIYIYIKIYFQQKILLWEKVCINVNDNYDTSVCVKWALSPCSEMEIFFSSVVLSLIIWYDCMM